MPKVSQTGLYRGTDERGEDVDEKRFLEAEEGQAYIRLLDDPGLHP